MSRRRWRRRGRGMCAGVEMGGRILLIFRKGRRQNPRRRERERCCRRWRCLRLRRMKRQDRKSTRLNSSHSQISYAVFCLQKKKSANLPYEDFLEGDSDSLAGGFDDVLLNQHLQKSFPPAPGL